MKEIFYIFKRSKANDDVYLSKFLTGYISICHILHDLKKNTPETWPSILVHNNYSKATNLCFIIISCLAKGLGYVLVQYNVNSV